MLSFNTRVHETTVKVDFGNAVNAMLKFESMVQNDSTSLARNALCESFYIKR